jgi:hypothetical protein
MPRLLRLLQPALLVLLGACFHAQAPVLRPLRVVGQPAPGTESALFLRIQVVDHTRDFNGFARLVLEGPLEGGAPQRIELEAGESTAKAIVASIAAPPHKLSELVAARAQPGSYRMVEMVVGAGSKQLGDRLTVMVTRVPLPRLFVIPENRIAYLGVYNIELTRAGTQLRTSVSRHESAPALLVDLKQFQREQRPFLQPFIARQPQVFAPALKPIQRRRAVPPSATPVCTPANAGECAICCDKGDGRCCTDLGVLYDRGRGVPLDAARAASLFAKGCELGNPLGCSNLGILYANGRGVGKDPARAAQHYRDACELGEQRGCNSLGWAYSNGVGVPTNALLAARYYASACDARIAAGCNDQGWLYFEGRPGIPKDPARGARFFKLACELKSANGCSSYGWALAKGLGVDHADPDQGLAHLKTGCSGGNRWGCDKQKVLCDGGHAASCASLADHHERGDGVTKDEALAATLRRKACDGGFAAACTASGTTVTTPVPGHAENAKPTPLDTSLCNAHAAYRALKWTVSISEEVKGGKTVKSKPRLAAERSALIQLAERIQEPKLAALRKRLVAAINAAPEYKNPVPRHLGGGADVVVSNALKAQLNRFWDEVAKRGSCANEKTCPPGSPIIDGKCAAH